MLHTIFGSEKEPPARFIPCYSGVSDSLKSICTKLVYAVSRNVPGHMVCVPIDVQDIMMEDAKRRLNTAQYWLEFDWTCTDTDGNSLFDQDGDPYTFIVIMGYVPESH